MVAMVSAHQESHCLVAVVAVIQFKATTAQQTTQVRVALEQHRALLAHQSLARAVAVVVLTADQEAQPQAQVVQAAVVQAQHLEQQQAER
jgi:K+/H+ antiporter YhaU regulatory subunit KhtT